MRRQVALVGVIAATGCGRIAFDSRDDGGIGGVDALVCPPGYTADSGGCYRTGVGTNDWLGAEAICEADGVGAHLVVIDSVEEAAVVDRYRPSNAWIGVSDLVPGGGFRTVTNRAPTYLVFSTGEPDVGADDCLLLGDNLDLGDGDCVVVRDYICEYDGIPAVSLAWGVCPPGYTFNQWCHRFVPGGGASPDWFLAEADCESGGPGMHLVVIDSLAEAMAVDTIVPFNILDHFIGATDLVTEGTYLTVTNLPLAFTTFQLGEPDGATAQNCMLLTDAVELKDGDCISGEDYVCEYDGIAPVPAAWGQ